jgi:hypothetical protein
MIPVQLQVDALDNVDQGTDRCSLSHERQSRWVPRHHHRSVQES